MAAIKVKGTKLLLPKNSHTVYEGSETLSCIKHVQDKEGNQKKMGCCGILKNSKTTG